MTKMSVASLCKLRGEFVTDDKAQKVAQKTPSFFSLKTDCKMAQAEIVNNMNRDKYVSLQNTLGVVSALMMTVAAAGIFMSKPNVKVTALGVTFCFSFIAYFMSTLVSVALLTYALMFDTEPEFQHWFKIIGKSTTMFPFIMMILGTLTLLWCIVENMTVHYSGEYTGCCLALCIPFLFGTSYVAIRLSGWASMIVQNTSESMATHINQDLTADGIRKTLKQFVEVENGGDPHKLAKETFVSRYMHTNSEFAVELANRIYDDFYEGLVTNALGGELKVSAGGTQYEPISLTKESLRTKDNVSTI